MLQIHRKLLQLHKKHAETILLSKQKEYENKISKGEVGGSRKLKVKGTIRYGCLSVILHFSFHGLFNLSNL